MRWMLSKNASRAKPRKHAANLFSVPDLYEALLVLHHFCRIAALPGAARWRKGGVKGGKAENKKYRPKRSNYTFKKIFLRKKLHATSVQSARLHMANARDAFLGCAKGANQWR
jgi:hypothetical protein